MLPGFLKREQGAAYHLKQFHKCGMQTEKTTLQKHLPASNSSESGTDSMRSLFVFGKKKKKKSQSELQDPK